MKNGLFVISLHMVIIRSLLAYCSILDFREIILSLFDINGIACACTICCFLKDFRKEIMKMIKFYLDGMLFVALWHMVSDQ